MILDFQQLLLELFNSGTLLTLQKSFSKMELLARNFLKQSSTVQCSTKTVSVTVAARMALFIAGTREESLNLS
jgi:hypothetical protein